MISEETQEGKGYSEEKAARFDTKNMIGLFHCLYRAEVSLLHLDWTE